MRATALFAALAAASLLAACGQGGSPVTDPVDAAIAQAEGKRFVDREAFTIVYRIEGMQTGTITEHTRDWGNRKAVVTDTVMDMMGERQVDKSRTVAEGPDIYSFNEVTNEWVVMRNPIYDAITEEMKGKSGVEFGKELMARMGGEPTGETGSFAGHSCAYYRLATVRTCITDWGATLKIFNETAGFRIEHTATEVRIGDGGPDSAFQIDKSKAVRLENMDEMTMEDLENVGKTLEDFHSSQ